ncbi:OsmC-like protein [Georgenia satyanarayanai]|uniref:OsmC-like protein n=1 Tax=Georgenia satyanarayanai TaxID=860221 RepID=A0A2Y9A6G9_9MICO|nr:OsmC-like protein [Georgenia satyanarayanai]SSA39940.1 OsmC-like protein [Georgenia satyanarayanai]
MLPDVPHEQAQELADQAHQVCLYSRATRSNIDVTVTVSDD